MGGPDGYYGLDVTDIPASPDEEWMPPIQSLLYKVQFYYKASSTQDFWIQEDEALVEGRK